MIIQQPPNPAGMERGGEGGKREESGPSQRDGGREARPELRGFFFFLLRSETGSVEQFYNNSSILLR